VFVNIPRGATTLTRKSLEGWFKTIFSMVFYIGVFSGIGYLLQLTLF
jgi:hypothetical protein